VASLSALGVGAVSTIPLASSSCDFLEMMIVLVAGMLVSRVCYSNMFQWLIFFITWMGLDYLDYLDHLMLGHNGSVAMFIGQHMLSWGLIGQMQLFLNVIRNGAIGYEL